MRAKDDNSFDKIENRESADKQLKKETLDQEQVIYIAAEYLPTKLQREEERG